MSTSEPATPGAGSLSEYDSALIEELAKKSWVSWVRYGEPPHSYPVWHSWVDGAVCVVGNGFEQPLPGIDAAADVEVDLRSKATRYLVATIRAAVQRIGPDSATWDIVTTALVAGRLNLVDPATAPQRWADECVVVRLTPTAVLAEGDTLPDDLAAAVPLPTPATTVAGVPKILHRRQTQRRRLS
ncbi:MAG: hypothetical protein ACRDP1_15460 [Nocardioidaceae bacterium]